MQARHFTPEITPEIVDELVLEHDLLPYDSSQSDYPPIYTRYRGGLEALVKCAQTFRTFQQPALKIL